ncbi:MAG: hypothetical protein WCH99_07525 [Verrucomicrobiota bacterium]
MNKITLKGVLVGLPGWVVLGMTSVWLMPFCIRDLIKHPLAAYWDSHLLYAVLFGTAILAMLTLNYLQLVTDPWRRHGIWLQVLSICGSYALTMFISLAIILTLDSARVLHYYGGDASGSVGLLIMPSVIAYSAIGALVASIAAIVSR